MENKIRREISQLASQQEWDWALTLHQFPPNAGHHCHMEELAGNCQRTQCFSYKVSKYIAHYFTHGWLVHVSAFQAYQERVQLDETLMCNCCLTMY